MNLIILGPPGSGKGTLAKLLSSELGVPHISTGEILREEVYRGSSLGEVVKPFMDAGKLVSDEVMLSLVEGRVGRPDCKKGFILDGFPRTILQAVRLDQMLSAFNRQIGLAMRLVVSEQCVVRRLGGRRICSSCGADYNLNSKPPQKEGLCDVCGGELCQREDDREDVILDRLRVYRKETSPIEEYYADQEKLIRINSEPDAAVVLKEILEKIRTR
jgi:adenylate kinase